MEDGILFFVIVIGGVLIGGHILYAITNLKHFYLLFEKVSFGEWVRRLGSIFGGSVFYGGLYGGLAAGVLASKILHLDLKLWADLMTPIIPLFHAFGRVGCFLAGCCYGIESDFGFTITNNEYIPSINGVSRFPVQLLEAVCNLALAFVMFRLLRKRENEKLKGNLIFIYLIIYGILRFLDEFLRGDLVRGFVGPLSTSQFISIISIALSSFLLYKSLHKKNAAEAIPEAEAPTEAEAVSDTDNATIA